MSDQGAKDITRTAAFVIILVGIVLAGLMQWDERGPGTFGDKFSERVQNLVLNLTVIAIFMERALAVINSAWLAEEAERARAALRAALVASARGLEEGVTSLSAAFTATADVEAKQRRVRAVVGFLFGLAISGAGIRTLGSLVTPPTGNTPTTPVDLFNFIDIILTAGLLAGGSEGMAKVAELIRAAIDRTTTRLQGLA